jgi:hypothetical protein
VHSDYSDSFDSIGKFGSRHSIAVRSEHGKLQQSVAFNISDMLYCRVGRAPVVRSLEADFIGM